MSFFDFLTSLFAPHECLGCQREGSLLCSACAEHLPSPPGRCFRCYQSSGQAACPSCLSDSNWHSLRVGTSYQGVSRELVACLKFQSNQAAALSMARVLLATGPLPSTALIVPVPATTAHIRQRGYDQAVLLARRLSSLSGARCQTVLARTGREHQLGAGRYARLQQLTGALRVDHPAVVRGQSIVLVDDVITTGASLLAASRVVRQAGAVRVDVLAFAQA